MASAVGMPASQQPLTAIIRRIRNRWRLKQALRGSIIVASVLLVAVVISPWLMGRFHFTPAAVVSIRLLTYGLLASFTVRYLVLPLRRRISDERVALYLEEYEPSLQAVVVSAVDAAAQALPAAVRSPHFVAQLIESAYARARAVGSDAIERRALTTSFVVLVGILAASLLLMATNPTARAGLNPIGNPLDRPFFITVQPGNAEAGLPTPTYRSLDTAVVNVTAEGLVTAHGTGSEAKVVAELTAGPLRHADTAWINVTNTTSPSMLANLSIHPVDPDSAFWGMLVARTHISVLYSALLGGNGFAALGGYKTLRPTAVDAGGNSVPDLLFEYTSLDPTVAAMRAGDGRRNGQVVLLKPGQVQLAVRTTAYGITRSDTATFTITMPTGMDVGIRPGPTGAPVFDASEVRIAPYGIVIWHNFVADSVDVTFDDPAKAVRPADSICDLLAQIILFLPLPPGADCASGSVVVPPVVPIDENQNIVQGSETNMRVMQFPEPGVYTYRSTRTGATGRVVVSATATEASNTDARVQGGIAP